MRPDGEGHHELPGLLPPEPVQPHHLHVSFAHQAGDQRLEDRQRIQLSPAEQGHEHRGRRERELEILFEVEPLHLRDHRQAGVGHRDAVQGPQALPLEIGQAGCRRSLLEHDRVVIDQGGREEPDLLADEVDAGRRHHRKDAGVGAPEDDGLLRRSGVEVLHVEHQPVALVEALLLDHLGQEADRRSRRRAGEDHLLGCGGGSDGGPGRKRRQRRRQCSAQPYSSSR